MCSYYHLLESHKRPIFRHKSFGFHLVMEGCKLGFLLSLDLFLGFKIWTQMGFFSNLEWVSNFPYIPSSASQTLRLKAWNQNGFFWLKLGFMGIGMGVERQTKRREGLTIEKETSTCPRSHMSKPFNCKWNTFGINSCNNKTHIVALGNQTLNTH